MLNQSILEQKVKEWRKKQELMEVEIRHRQTEEIIKVFKCGGVKEKHQSPVHRIDTVSECTENLRAISEPLNYCRKKVHKRSSTDLNQLHSFQDFLIEGCEISCESGVKTTEEIDIKDAPSNKFLAKSGFNKQKPPNSNSSVLETTFNSIKNPLTSTSKPKSHKPVFKNHIILE